MVVLVLSCVAIGSVVVVVVTIAIALGVCRAAAAQITAADLRRDRALELLAEAERQRDEFLDKLKSVYATSTEALALYREAFDEIVADLGDLTEKNRVH